MKRSRRSLVLMGWLGIFLTVGLSACQFFGIGGSSKTDYTATLQSGGFTRSYVMHVPTSYQSGTAVPLLLFFHGGGGAASTHGTAAGINELTGFNQLADQKDFI